MPTISPQLRASIGGTGEQAPQRRATVTAQTGMTMSAPQRQPEPEVKNPTETKSLAQIDTAEETTAQAVTLSPQLTALARKQQKLHQELQALKAREDSLKAREADFIPKSEFKSKLQQNAAEALKTLGVDYEELTQALLSQQSGDDPVKKLASEFELLKKQQEETVNKQYQATLKQYRAETDSLIATDPKAYHFISKGKKNGLWGEECPVTQHIVETWQENPDKVLTVEQAAKEVEEVLREDAKAAAQALRELDPPKQEETEPQAETGKRLPPPQRSAATTLTQRVETSPTRTFNQFQHLSMKERIAQAIARSQR